MTALPKLARSLIVAVALSSVLALAGCSQQPPQPSKHIAEQATTMNRLQINMASSISARMAKIAASGRWTPRLGFVTLHDNVLVFWVSAAPSEAEVKAALKEVAAWLSEYQGSLYTVLEIRDYSTAGNYGEYPIARPEMGDGVAAPASGAPTPGLAVPGTVTTPGSATATP